VCPGTALGAEDRLLLENADAIVGVDEVGRGALAGPVVVCAVQLAAIPDDSGIRDSKRLSEAQREAAAQRLRSLPARWAVCEIGVEIIDRINILEATRLAMRATALSLVGPGTVVVTDFVDPGDLGCRVLSPKRADGTYFCVAAASILAKVHRDRLMVQMAQKDQRWNWEKNKGYGTAAHRMALEIHGPSLHHRRSFKWSPVLP
jgi:ribonuclease HII